MAKSAPEVRELLPGVFSIATDYPEVADAPQWVYIMRGDQTLMCDAACTTTYDSVLRNAFSMIGMSAADLDWLLLSHGHADHTGAAGSLRAAGAPCRVAAPLEDVAWIESFERQWRDFWKGHPGVVDVEPAYDELLHMGGGDLPVDLILRDRDVFDLGNRQLTVHTTRGHTNGHSAFFDADNGVLLTGDLGLGRTISTISGTSSFGPLYMDVDDHLTGLRRLRDLPFTWVCPAHMEAVPRERGLELFDEAIAFVEEIDNVVMGALADKGGTVSMTHIVKTLGEFFGMTPPVWVHGAYVAQAHLRRAASRGLVEPSWTTPA